MSNASVTRTRGDLVLRVFVATIGLVLAKGVRRIRTADIAIAADTTESTLFRHFSSLDDVLQKTYDHCWGLINSQIERSSFDNPLPGTPTEQLLSDMSALWALRRDPKHKEAATLAFLFMRRRTEIFAEPSEASDQQLRFERRIERLCEMSAAAKAAPGQRSDLEPGLLAQLLLNYAATVWLTWFCMPTGSNDLTTDHDLSEEEAQLGVLVLFDRFFESHYPDGASAPREIASDH